MLGSGPDTHPLSNMLTREHKLLSTPAGATSLLPDVPCNTKTAQQPYLLQTLQISLCSRLPICTLDAQLSTSLFCLAGALYASERSLAAVNPGDLGFVIPGQVRFQIFQGHTC